MKIKLFLFIGQIRGVPLFVLAFLISGNTAFGQIAEMKPESLPELNQQLRYGSRRTDTLEQFNDAKVLDGWDIDNGTMDGVQIGGTTATGELLVNDASDDADGLGSQGTSGQFLQSAGAGANPTWAIDNYPSNVLFQYNGSMQQKEYTGTSLEPSSPSLVYRYLSTKGATYTTIWTTRWTKIAGVQTVTILCRIWIRTGLSSLKAPNLQVDIGGQSGNVTGTATTDPQTATSPEWKSFTIDVSGLTNGTVYDVTASMKDASSDGGPDNFCGNIIAIGS